MDMIARLQRLCHVEIRRLVMIIGMVVAVILVFQSFVLPYGKTLSVSLADKGSMAPTVGNAITIINDSKSIKLDVALANDEKTKETYEDYDESLDVEKNLDDSFRKHKDGNLQNGSTFEKGVSYGNSSAEGYVTRTDDSSIKSEHRHLDNDQNTTGLTSGGVQNRPSNDSTDFSRVSSREVENLDSNSRTSKSLLTANLSLVGNVKQTSPTQPLNIGLPQAASIILNDKFTIADISMFKRLDRKQTSVSQMNSLLLQSQVSSRSVKPRWSSVRDRELLSAKLEIKNAPVLRDTSGLDASVFRNASTFIRSYKLMERILKIYIYKEGEKPVFHQPYMRGIYASEGWFMKLIEGNKKFTARDPKKAHLFYLPFSVKMLRFAQNFNKKDLQRHLKNYVDLIAGKYRFWNRTGGADHFLVACHDWAPELTKRHMRNCIRALCNANVAKGFKIGIDTTLPVTYIRSMESPQEEIGGRPPLERSTLAFFAGSMHGYLRPILVKFWENKEADMKIFGPMPRDIEGKRIYREHMKSSKYCICARGYEVHTPRVVEAIFYECVPVIIADNYVPPFFEVLNWDSFSVFVREKDIPNLRNILLSIPEEKYLLMQSRVKMVQKHFLWHKKPVKTEEGLKYIFALSEFPVMDLVYQFKRLFHNKTQRWLFVVGMVAVTHLLFQSLLLPYGKALQSLLPDDEVSIRGEISHPNLKSLTNFVMVRNPLTVNDSDFTSFNKFDGFLKPGDNSNGMKFIDIDTKNGSTFEEQVQDDFIELVTDRELDSDSTSDNVEDFHKSFAVDSVNNGENSSILELAGEAKLGLPLEQIVKPKGKFQTENILEQHTSQLPKGFGDAEISSSAVPQLRTEVLNANSSSDSVVLKTNLATSKNVSARIGTPGKKKMRCDMPPKSITLINEMDSILMRHRRSSRSMRPRWSSIRDREILAARTEIEKAPIALNDQELYAPLYRNVSMFKRSYELMDRILRVYVYKDGRKPIFHQPILKGLYASEGWFMKLMEGNKRFVVKDPRKAHLFYMPFSSRMLEYTLYVRNSHNRTNLRQYLKEYSEKIAAKYPYFNRTGGADHFLVACHDWAPYETRHHMEHCIKALCNADVTAGFKLGRDVSLPETYVRSARNPLRDLGGKPPSQRPILCFYAGNMHGYLRPILIKHWKDKDPDMKIFGPMPPGVASKMNYIQYMKSSKYCICPKGYEVNSPRVVEAIFYECVPVIISDNFVPPFFEVLNWGAFSVIIAESDIPNLKKILLSIPEQKYLQMQLAVRKVQRHFLWHAKPQKYDLFYMTLHSIWYNRVYQIKPR
ncbi:hypothetical protein EZV62_012801 [Acer yangbiense]|uniref:Exostosin GT47 domain-containing protein n=1 Tax=Acer yangbiense TaxID=1000413 RepID=A0A5C7HX81_9ROSI|nr:hypothetical protein EZV62_012801 [Acer yangbiense]